MKTYKVTLTDLSDMVFNVYVEAFSADIACALVAEKNLYIVSVEC